MRAQTILFLGGLIWAAATSYAGPRIESATKSTYIISFDEAPLSSFRGAIQAKTLDGRTLAPTAPEVLGSERLDPDAAASRAYLEYLDRRHGEFLAAARAQAGRALTPRFRYRYAANGMALELTAQEARALERLPQVAAVRPDRAQKLLTDAGPIFIGANELWNGNVAGVAATKGEGAVVGVIDSGLNFSHPSFAATGGDGFTPSNPRGRVYGLCLSNPARCNGKLIGIYDFTQEGSRDGTDLNGHGSHVAETAVGHFATNTINGHTITIALTLSGVAPHANLIVYKACGENNSCFDSATLAAIDQATADRVDVLNYSIGGLPDDPWDGLRANRNDIAGALLNARAAGVFPSVAAGNAGPEPGTIDHPANSPWVIAVAAASHDRRFVTTLDDVTGPGVVTPQAFIGEAISGALAKTRLIDAADFGFPLCGTGEAAGVDTPGSDNPWPAGTFHGEIVVCLRGVYARVNKGFNVKQAGGGGMILVNSAAEAESRVADDHYLPAVHLGYVDGQRLYGLLAQAKAASGFLSGAITATERRFDGRGDVLAGFSSRGPVEPHGGWLKPNVTAPGVNILAAAKSGTGFATLSGTSMAAPHVAGAAALLRSAHPGWSVSHVESAVLTQGIDDVLKEDAATPATPHDGGGGRAYVPNAVRSGLTFHLTSADFRNADPLGGAILDFDPPPLPNPVTRGPSALNLPYLAARHCFEQCTLSRTVTDNGAGSAWRAELHLPDKVIASVSPSSFALAPGGSQRFSVAFDVREVALTGSWVYGNLTLVNTSGGAPNVRLPVAVFADPGNLPEELQLLAPADGGYSDITLSGLARLSNPRLLGGGLVPIRVDSRSVPQDPNPSELFTLPRTGAYFVTLPLENELDAAGNPVAETLEATILAETSSATSRNVDLYVGIDSNGNGKPDSDETLCQRQSTSVAERCLLHRNYANGASPPLVWFLVQNLAQGNSGGDNIGLRYAVATRDSGRDDTTKAYARYGLLRATGPGKTNSGDPVPVRVSWTTPGMLPGETWLSVFAMSASPGGTLFGSIPVMLEVSSSAPHLPVLLSGLNDSVAIRLAPNTRHDRLALDVPPNASALTVTMSGSGEADLYVIKSTGEPPGPAVGFAPPQGQAQGVSAGPGSSESVALGAPTLTPGRWYLAPVNSGTSIADVTVVARLSFSGNAPETADSAYFDPNRSGHGMFLNSGSGQWVAFWYTYLQDASPIWYLAQASAPATLDGVWSTPLLRFTWNGAANFATTVGRLTLVRTETNRVNFNWLLDGTYGSESMVALTLPGSSCPTVAGQRVDYSGAWYAPLHSGYGYSVVTTAGTETEVAYLYDAPGNPRWLYGQNSPFGNGTFALTQYTGFCPLCTFVPIQGPTVGQLQRTFTDPHNGTAAVNASFVAPAVGSWTVNDVTQKLTRDITCQ